MRRNYNYINEDKLIQEVINSYLNEELIKEEMPWAYMTKKFVHIDGVFNATKSILYGHLERQANIRVYIYARPDKWGGIFKRNKVAFQCSETGKENDWHNAKISNLPQKGTLYYFASGANGINYGFDADRNIIPFKYDQENNTFINTKDNTPIKVEFFNQQGNSQQQETSVQQGSTTDDTETPQGTQQTTQTDNYQGGTQQGSQIGQNGQMGGGLQQGDTQSGIFEPETTDRSDILNVNENYPLSNALHRILERYGNRINRTRTANMISQLENIGL